MSDDKVRDALARLLFQIDLGDDQPPEQVPDVCYEDADAILASDVLATIRADAQREVADALAALPDEWERRFEWFRFGDECARSLRAALAPYRAEGST